MTLAFKYFLFSRKIASVTFLNGLIFYVKRIPFVGKYISGKAYQMYEEKLFWHRLTFVFQFLLKPFHKILWIGVYYAIGCFLKTLIDGGNFLVVFASFDQRAMILGGTAWLCLVPFIGKGTGRLSNLFSPENLSVMFSFQLDRKAYCYSCLYIDFFWHWFSYIPAFFLLGGLFHLPIFALDLFLSYGILVAFGELIKRYSFLYQWKKGRMFSGYFLFVVLLCVPLWVLLIQNTSTSLFTGIISVGLGVFVSICLAFLRRFPENDYLIFLINEATQSNQELEKWRHSEVQEGLSMQEKLTLTPSKHISFEGSKYLNTLLFSRYRKQLNRSLAWRLGSIFVGGCSIVALSVIKSASFLKTDLLDIIPGLFFIMYLTSFGKRIVVISFVNCDVSMLYYPFYRESKTILEGFWYRLKETLKYNSLIAGLFFFFFLVLKGLHPSFLPLSILGLIGFSLISLTLLFSFHELFVYYLLQPFSGEMQVVNPLYKMINNGMYFVAYFVSRTDFRGIYFVLFLSIISLFYVFIGLVIITKKAPSTFRIKE